jgi:hypothetical protein
MDAATRVEAKYRRATTPHHPLRDFTSTPSNESMSRPPSVLEAAERVQWAFLAETQPALEDRVFFWAGACRFLSRRLPPRIRSLPIGRLLSNRGATAATVVLVITAHARFSWA